MSSGRSRLLSGFDRTPDGAGPDHAAATGTYIFAPFRLDIPERTLTREGVAVPLPPKCFELLSLLVAQSGRLVDKSRLMTALWPDTFVVEANLPNMVSLIRKALGDSRGTPQYVQTVAKRGYRFIAAVEHVSAAADAASATLEHRPIRFLAFPFRSESSDEPDYLAYSLPDAIGNTLTELNAFTVRSIQTAMRFDPLRWDPQSVGAAADVDVILAGTLGAEDDRLHATTQLLDAASGTVVWSKAWNFRRREAHEFQQGVVQLIVRSVLRRPPDRDEARPVQPEAYELYLRANRVASNRTPESIMLARDLYVACTEQDPDYAPAWARLGRCHRFLQKFGAQPGEQAAATAAAEAAFQRAFQLVPDLPIAHSLYTPLQADAGQAEQAMVRLLRQARDHTSDPDLFAALVHACRYCGHLDASLGAHTRAHRLDRHAHTSVAHTYFAMGDYEKALFWYGTGAGLYLDAAALASLGRTAEASALLWTRRDRFHLMPALLYALKACLEGDVEGAVRALQTDEASWAVDPEMRFYMARQAARLGAIELAERFLSDAIARGYCSSIALTTDPWFESLRTTPAFEPALRVTRRREQRARAAFLEAGGQSICGITSPSSMALRAPTAP